MTENEIKEATIEDAIYCAKVMAGIEVCEECRFYRLCHIWCDDVYRIMVKALEEIQQYRAIGTVEEFKALKEKNEAKKPIDISRVRDCEGYIGLIGKCPCCGEILEDDAVHCDCGQKLDWQ